MMLLDAKALNHKSLNDAIRRSGRDIRLVNVLGQRFIAAGMSDKALELHGTPGNALGAYLNGATINVFGNAQDAVGDTMHRRRARLRDARRQDLCQGQRRLPRGDPYESL